MKTRRIAKRALAVACTAAIASFAFAGSAFAVTVHGADFHGSGSALESGEVDVLDVDGSAGETVFLTVKENGVAIARNLPYSVAGDASAADGAEYAGVATLDITDFNLDELDGAYAIEAYSDRSGATQLYSGVLYGVYADLPDGTQKLIGTRTVNASEASRAFEPAETLYAGGRTYRLAGEASGMGALHFPYEAYDEATTVDGVIKYVDASGNAVAATKIPGLAYGETRTVDIPTAVTADNGDLYRTVFFQGSVKAVNPGATSFSVYCVKMSDASQALAGFYVATINMVDKDGSVIASDSVNVTGEFVYTAPAAIYKTENVGGESRVVTYTIDGSPVIRLSAANDGVLNRARTITVSYSASTAAEKETEVTFNLIDGSKRVGDDGRLLGTKKVVASKDAAAKPDAQVEFSGTTFNIAGSPDDYAYEVNSGAAPVVDVYYTPEGYAPPGPYEVTVSYVDFATRAVIETHSYTSDESANVRMTIETPAEFSLDGVDYVRLDGQEDAIVHSYYSGVASYTVYYRDKANELVSGTVINRIRVVYAGGGTTATGTTGAGDAAAADGATVVQLNGGRTYNVMDGDGNATLTNEGGVDSNTERIEDSETPLASGFDKGAQSDAASTLAQMAQWLVPAGIAVVVAVIAVVAAMSIRRRKQNEANEA